MFSCEFVIYYKMCEDILLEHVILKVSINCCLLPRCNFSTKAPWLGQLGWGRQGGAPGVKLYKFMRLLGTVTMFYWTDPPLKSTKNKPWG